jgi:hypothetical protein
MPKSFRARRASRVALRSLGAGVVLGATLISACSLLTDTNGLVGGNTNDASFDATSSTQDSSVPTPPIDAGATDSGATVDATARPDGSLGLDAGPDAPVDAGAPDTATDASLSYAATILSDLPLAYWRLDEPSGTTAHDATGHGNTATIGTGAAWGSPGAISGDPNTAVHLSTDGFNAGPSFDFPGNAPYTLEGWLSPEVIDNTYRHLFSKNDEAADGGREEYGLFVQSTETFVFERFVAGTSVKTHATLPPLNQYTYVVATYDGTSMAFYVNGALVSAAPDTRPQQSKPVAEFFGCKATQNGVLQGLIDEVAIYDHALPAASIAAHWAASMPH